MVVVLERWLGRRTPRYARRPPLVLINGLAEQAETWFRNVDAWRRHFTVHAPDLLDYEGESLHRRIADGLPVDVEYLVERLRLYLDEFAASGPYHLAANSLGGKVAVEFAVRRPELVSRLVLLCPSGLGTREQLPVVTGVRRGDARGVVDSVFFDRRRADPGLTRYYRERFRSKRWRTGLLRTVRGTTGHRVRDLLPRVARPTLLVVGREDRVVDPDEAISAAALLPHGRLEVLSRCGHAPQIEHAATVNRLVIEFLTRS